MNQYILAEPVQTYINDHIKADVNKIALAKPLFEHISSSELAGQIIAKRKSAEKLPTWYHQKNIYYPVLLSIEQCSSETTAAYKANLAIGDSLIDLTAGFGVDSYCFAQKIKKVYSCEINDELSIISAHNAKVLNAHHIVCLAEDGIELLKNTSLQFDTIYIDPARRNQSSKVFRLKDCTPDVTKYLTLFLANSQRIIIKTSPLLDITAGLNDLQGVSEIHIVSLKNECKELLWVIDKAYDGEPQIVCATLNEQVKTFSFAFGDLKTIADIAVSVPSGYLYEPDVALLKSGAFNLIAKRFALQKLHQHSQLYFSPEIKPDFLGRIFEINAVLSLNEFKKEKNLAANVIVRNFPESVENLVKKYKIIPSHNDFLLFTQGTSGYMVIKARIIQHY